MRAPAPGFSLVELVVAIVIVGVAVGGVLAVFAVAVSHSADPLQQEQAIAIAQGTLDEILARPALDPDGLEDESRPQFDDVGDFDGIDDASPRGASGELIPDLDGYRVRVHVTAAVPFPDPSSDARARRVDVEVSRGPGVDVTISGYRLLD